jgi:type III restriction enzyme
MGGLQEDVWQVQIRETVEKHLKKEKEVQGRGVKVLTLFFIDRVANYRSYDPQGNPVKGKFALASEEALRELTRRAEYRGLLPFEAEQLHNGYFAQDKKGVLKESREGRITEADEDVFNLIMKDKERLLSFDEPLRFIFSHSSD